MRKTVFIFLVVFGGTLSAFAQSSTSDTLRVVRKLFHTNIYRNNDKLSKADFNQSLVQSIKWGSKNRTANIFLIAAPILSTTGAYLAYDAIKGVPKVAVIDGKSYPYVVRSLPELVGGLALLVTGFCLIESANESKMNAAKWYNGEIKKAQLEEQSAFNLKLNITKSGQFGLVANF